MLNLSNVVTSYGQVEVLHGVDLEVRKGELLALIGANGAGKSSLLRLISGLNPLNSGSILFSGNPIGGLTPAKVASLGIVHVPENRRVFGASSVEANLVLGAFPIRPHSRTAMAEDLGNVYDQFPRLAERRKQLAGALSGGEQQILAIAMGLMARPELIMLDEPSLGLAPVWVDRVFEAVVRLRESGKTVLLVEQLANVALSVADRGVVMQHGQVVASGSAAELANDPAVKAAYLGAEQA